MKTCVPTVSLNSPRSTWETSFMTAPQVREIMEAMVRQLWLEVKGVDLGEFPIVDLRRSRTSLWLR
ncbi:hypothetical protein LNP74_27520 [Klebsiella pneumoniae subsp. pneumoniae]|nr:hypothetical protein [Klebsiella pneumoniae subsp. pneumoniae]